MHSILLLNGPNLNLLGTREPEIYGSATLRDVVSALTQQARAAQVSLDHLQSNGEADLIEKIHTSAGKIDFILINPGAFTHTSLAIRDALLGTGIPFIEVHLSNLYAREPFRRHSYFSDVADGIITGLGIQGYTLALQAAISKLQTQ